MPSFFEHRLILLFWRLLFLSALFVGLSGTALGVHSATHAEDFAENRTEILFVQGNLPERHQLIPAAELSIQVFVLDPHADGLRQMADALKGRRNIGAVHVISHGAPGAVTLGSTTVDEQSVGQRTADIARIRAALSDNADLLLYGCNVAQGFEGERFIAALAKVTGAHVAASTNLTGDKRRGGDWVLEHQTGPIHRAALAFPAYGAVLPTVSGTVNVNTPSNWVNFGSTLNDNEGDNGDIPGIVYEMFFADATGAPSGTLATFNNGLGAVGTVLILDTSPGSQTNDSANAFVIRSQAGKFKLSSFLIQDYYGMNSNYTATPYLNGAVAGAAYPFTITQSGGYARTVNLPAQFASVTEVRITSDGGSAPQPGGKNIWQGFNTFVFADPVYSTNANLSALTPSTGTLSPAFAAGTTSYTNAVLNAVASITFTPTVSDTGRATVAVNGVAVTSGAASGAIALNVGANTITTIVTAEDGAATKTYTTTVTRAAPPSSNANLSLLTVSNGTLAPIFASGTTAYAVNVPFATASLAVTPTKADANAAIAVNGVAVGSGNASGAIALAVGNNTITIVVTAQDSSTKTYSITATRAAASSNNQLSALSLSSGTVAPAFVSGTTSYTANVSNATNLLTVTPTLSDATATVTVNGVATASGSASGALALNVGSNTITIWVTAQNGSPLNYTITVSRAGSANANLSALSLSSGTLSPAFVAGVTGYTASVPNATTSLTVTPTVAQPNASVTINGVTTSSGNASGAIPLAVGANIITTIVTAEDGFTTKTYTATVTRVGSSDANLSALTLSGGTLSPLFASSTINYTMSVASSTGSITVTPTVNQPGATVTVNGITTTSASASAPVTLAFGNTSVTVVVTAQDANSKIYTVTVARPRDTNSSGTLPSGGGVVTATLVGPAGCGFERAAFISASGSVGSPPAISGYGFAQGLFDVEVGGCAASATVTITLTYPQQFATGSVYMKYGPTTVDPTPHWYAFPGAVVNGNIVTLTLTDGVAGDDDMVANGRVVDPGGVAFAIAPSAAVSIPTLSEWGVALLVLLMGGIAATLLQRRR